MKTNSTISQNSKERIKQGQINSNKIKVEKAKKKYFENPKYCPECNKMIPYERRHLNVFCDQSCAAKYNNKERAKTKEKYKCSCENCGKEFVANKASLGKYCSVRCSREKTYKNYIENWKKGLETGLRGIKTLSFSGHIKRYIHEKYNKTCQCCGNDTWNGKPIPLEIDHIDGNHLNNKEENLNLICPNCHAQTSNYKGANKGKGRHFRMVNYHEGKSY